MFRFNVERSDGQQFDWLTKTLMAATPLPARCLAQCRGSHWRL